MSLRFPMLYFGYGRKTDDCLRLASQCAKRKLKCIYPATSRRGIRPRMYDLTDDSFRRPSDSVAL